MKKILIIILFQIAIVSCYDDYIKDFDYISVYFPNQIAVRTFVVGEGMKIEVGAALGGARENSNDRNVKFSLNNSLITQALLTSMKNSSMVNVKDAVASVTELKPLPSKYYTLSNSNTIVILAGNHNGTIVVKPDSASFLADPATLSSTFILPFYINEADADTILESKRTAMIGVKYENMLFGNYWHGGVTVEKTPAGNIIKTTPYYTAINAPTNLAWVLKTVEPFALTVNGYSNIASSPKQEMKLTLSGGKVTVSSVTGASVVILPDGESTYNQAKLLQDRKIFLKYKYINAAGNTCFAQDTLIFRNRLRDGVNEWKDENQSNY